MKCDSCGKDYERRDLLICGYTILKSLPIYECKICWVTYAAKQFPNSQIKVTV
jgi:transposase-like protein